jgi:hypothetical protein
LSSRHAISAAYAVRRDAMMLADLGPAQAREERLGHVGRDAADGVGDAVVDAMRD